MLYQVDWSGRCGDSCGISVTGETPQTTTGRLSARPAESEASWSGNQPLVPRQQSLRKQSKTKKTAGKPIFSGLSAV
ncbi:hypothetical protein [Bacillus sp. MUM 13]|uniref:hypothetical protein n=1 Tax=Bacillus sp. MUM 13 TaxID=1678001 RepID=UPI0008F5D361|nr:hypothetical protein [Bacillus sp. MUM 13]OIK11701.1 hypothetical protein BIV59_11755 [Bacillus sp. MUM 13]